LGRIVLTIVPLLSLSADQTSKMAAFIQEIGLAPDPDGRVVQSINLDVLRDSRLNADVCQRLEAMKWDTADTTFLFSSPQKIVNSKKWQTTINRLIAAGTLSMVAVDECHLFASQGMEFRNEFQKLKHVLFLNIQQNSAHRIPILTEFFKLILRGFFVGLRK
jgi:superfamily II DNA helicase RecQ